MQEFILIRTSLMLRALLRQPWINWPESFRNIPTPIFWWKGIRIVRDQKIITSICPNNVQNRLLRIWYPRVLLLIDLLPNGMESCNQ
ncbi:UNVERIFIED_CONTAM: hypothetical protein GTU68_003857 [Idotea baltica]|nr:hypothetical protein [Idotea baltica]